MLLRSLALLALLCLSGGAQAHGHPRVKPGGHHGHQGYGVPWCGLFMMQHTGIHGPGNLARAIEWKNIGQAASGPAPGVIGVMAHHVFQVVQVLGLDRRGNQTVLAISGNDGNAVRTRPRSTAGVVAWRRV